MSSTSTQDERSWIDRTEYPFESHYLDLDPGQLHYLDEGEGQSVVMLHGNPTWSFQYRHLIKGLADAYRCIAPDYFGFGLSEKPPEWSYRPEDHAQVFEDFITALGLTDFTLIVEDWGGPIGLSYAVAHPENVRSVVVNNTFMWPVDDIRRFRAFSTLAGGRLGRFLNTRYNFLAKTVMKRTVGDRARLPPEIHAQYLQPLSNPDERKGTWIFPRHITTSTPWLGELWDQRSILADKQALLCWGLKDPGFRVNELRRWQALFPEARSIVFEDAGHYLHEEKGSEMVPEIRAFLSQM